MEEILFEVQMICMEALAVFPPVPLFAWKGTIKVIQLGYMGSYCPI